MRVLIADDEKPARDRLRQLLEDLDTYEVVGEAANGEEAVTAAADTQPDIVLLDIRMPGLDGIEAAHHLNQLENPPAVVFTTAYDEYAIEAFEARAIGYVLKPVRRDRLAGAMEHAAKLAVSTLKDIATDSQMDMTRKHVCARAHGQLRLIPIEDIYAFQADQKYVSVHHVLGRDLIDESLKSLEAEFADEFVRIHRGAVVAVRKIEQLARTSDGKHYVVLRDGASDEESELTISRRHLAEVRKRLKGA